MFHALSRRERQLTAAESTLVETLPAGHVLLDGLSSTAASMSGALASGNVQSSARSIHNQHSSSIHSVTRIHQVVFAISGHNFSY